MKCNYKNVLLLLIILIGINLNIQAQYCNAIPLTASEQDISYFSFAGLNNNSFCSTLAPGIGSIAGRYSNYTTSVAPATVFKGGAYSFSVNIEICSASILTSAIKIFIDFNHDSILDFSEEVYVSAAATLYNYTIFGNIHIPSTADTGLTLLRIVNSETNLPSSISACSASDNGETEDYAINILTASACTGTINPGVLNISNATGCANKPITLILSGYTQATGVSLLWQYTTDLLNWFNTGDSTPSINISFPSLDSIFYRVALSCNGGPLVYSTIAFLNLKPLYSCYCSSNLGAMCSNTIAGKIDSVMVLGTTLKNQTICTTGYTSFFPITSNTTAQLEQAIYYTIKLYTNAPYAGVWIDTDGSNSFDPSEFMSFTIFGGIGTAVYRIDPFATIGKTGMRIRTSPFSLLISSTAACNYFVNNGEVQDYVVDITPGILCSGLPYPGVLSVFQPINPNPCPSSPLDFVLTGTTLGINSNLDWEESIDGGLNWNAIASNIIFYSTIAPSSYEDSLWIRAVINCNNGPSVYSNIIKVKTSNFYDCYCTQNLGDSCGKGQINDFYLTGASLNNLASGCVEQLGPLVYGPYTKFPILGNTTAILQQSTTYTAHANFGDSVAIAGIWIDYDRSGVFDFQEYSDFVFLSPNNTSASVAISIPATAQTGLTGLRVRSAPSPFFGLFACGGQAGGETEDYVVTLSTFVGASFIKDFSSDIVAYPNPTTGLLNIHLSDKFKINTTIIISNVIGKEVFSELYYNLKGNDVLQINMHNFANGTYSIKAINNNNICLTKVAVVH